MSDIVTIALVVAIIYYIVVGFVMWLSLSIDSDGSDTDMRDPDETGAHALWKWFWATTTMPWKMLVGGTWSWLVNRYKWLTDTPQSF